MPTRGVRQGDPLSPYLFILCLEHLSIHLEKVVQDKLLHPMSFRGRIRISHLFFIDDIFLFTKATTRDRRRLNTILQTFCASSGQIMSATESRIWFSHRIPRRTKDQVVGILASRPQTALALTSGPLFSLRAEQLTRINI